MTATERHFKGKSDEVTSTDNEEIYGKTFFLLSFKEALARGILCDYEVLTVGVRESEVEQLRSKAEFEQLIAERKLIELDAGNFDEIAANEFASLIALRRAVEKYQIKHAVSFHTRIQYAEYFRSLSERFNQTFQNLPKIPSFHIMGTMASSERNAILRQFKTLSPSLVTNAKCLTEGIDIPEIDCVMFVDPKSSKVDIVQAAGRAMRNTPGKTKSYIVLPFVVRDGATLDEAAACAGFDVIITVLRVLASQDERIAAELRAISRGSRSARSGILNFDLSAVVPTHVEAEKFIEAIELKCWGKLKNIAYMPYEEAAALVQKLGIKTQKQFRAWRRGERPDLPQWPRDLPGSPDDSYYKRGWVDWGTFFNSGYIWSKYKKFLPFAEAREFVRKIGLKSIAEWEAYSANRLPGKPKRPANLIPARPDIEYAEDWIDWPDFMGYENRSEHDWWPFEQARAWVHKLELWRYRPQGGGQVSWKEYCAGRIPNLPPRPQKHLPTDPGDIYKNSGWKGYSDWVGSPQSKLNRSAIETRL